VRLVEKLLSRVTILRRWRLFLFLLSALHAAAAQTVTTYYLHGTSATPPGLFFNTSSPTGSSAKSVDSASVNFSGGNPWKSVGTWAPDTFHATGNLTSLADLHVWLGLKNSDDQGTQFDLRAEVYKNSQLITAGQTLCITSLTTNANNAKEVLTSFPAFSQATFNGTSDVLSIKLWTRIGTNPDGSKCSGPGGSHNNAQGLRAYFDSSTRTSRFGAALSTGSTPPTITAALSPVPNANGWNNTNVTVTFTCTPGSNPIQSCPSPVVVTSEAANQVISGTVTDTAGLTATTSAAVSLDKTLPSITASVSPAPNANGWNTTPVTVNFTCTDNLSGIATCPTSQQVTSPGANQVVTGSATDRAGNTASTSATVNISTTLPTITATVSTPPNANGWNNTSVTVSFQCSGSANPLQCSGPQVVNREGASQAITGTVTDAAGQTASTTVAINIDEAVPVISASTSPSPNQSGVVTVPATVTLTCSDVLSGIATCPPSIPITGVGINQITTGTATDRAGNSTTTSVSIKSQATPLTLAAQATPVPNAAGWNNTDITITTICSGGVPPLQCPLPMTVSTEGNQQIITESVADSGLQTASGSVIVSIDKTPPTITINTPVDGSLATSGAVTVQGQVSDSLSGLSLVTCNGANAVVSESSFTCSVNVMPGANTISVSAADTAGNSATSSIGVMHTTPIRVHITNPSALQLFSSNPIAVTGTVDMPGAAVTVGGITATVSAGNFTASGVTLREGTNLLTASATGPNGATGAETATVFLDTTPPVVHIDSPENGATLTSSQINVAGSVNDVVSGTVNADQATVSINGVQAAVVNRSFVASNILLVPGQNLITAIATDRAGNTNQHQVRVTLQQFSGQQHLVTLSGDSQIGPVGSILAQPLVVQAVDGLGRPMPNRAVTVQVFRSDGIVIAGLQRGRSLTLQTDAQGNISVQFQVGTRVGVGINQVMFSAAGFVGSPVFTASSTVGPVAGVRIVSGATSGAIQKGAVNTALAEPLEVVAIDAKGNFVSGVPITFAVRAGGGLVDGASSIDKTTDGDGRAFVVFTLGPQAGANNNSVTAAVKGTTAPAAVFMASAVIAGPPSATTVSGVVMDNANQPIPNATASIKGTNLSATTNAQGQFAIADAPVGDIVLFVDGSTSTRPEVFPTLSFQLATVSGVDNSLFGPIFLPAVDTDNSQVVGGDQDVILTMKGVPGVQYKVFAHSVTFPDGSHTGSIRLSQVHADRVPMAPPNGGAPSLAATLQPAGVAFDPPVQIQVPNIDGLPPGQVVDLFGYRHDLEQFVSEGIGRVSADGSVIVTDPGSGLRVAGWHLVQPTSSSPVPSCARNVFASITSAPDDLDIGDNDTADASGSADSPAPGCPSSSGSYQWSSDAPDIIRVSGSGVSATLTGTAIGDANIVLVYTADGASDTQTHKVSVASPELKCSNVAPTRGDNVTCTVSHFPKDATFKWQFDGDDGGNVKETTTVNKWIGPIVESGQVSVTMLKADGTPVKKNPDPITLTVMARTGNPWTMSTPAPAPKPNGTFVSLPVPLNPFTLNGKVYSGHGFSQWRHGYKPFFSTLVKGGPNGGYQYFLDPLVPDPDKYYFWYEINPDLTNSQSGFYIHQCGDYPTNPNGFASGLQQLTQTQRHEYAGAVQSHYQFWITTFPQHDVQQFFEQQVLAPGQAAQTWVNGVVADINTRLQAIQQDTDAKGEPYPVNFDENNNPLGNINYGGPQGTQYKPCTPGINTLAPSSGAVGTSLTINGYNFGDAQNQSTITIGGVPATANITWSNFTLSVTVPANVPVGAQGVVVTVPGNGSSTPASFTVTRPN
jgi:hypothetical protein